MARNGDEVGKVRLEPAKLEEFKPSRMQKFYEEKDAADGEPIEEESEANEFVEFQTTDKPRRGNKQAQA